MDCVETIKNKPKSQKDLDLIVNKFSSGSYRIQSQKSMKQYFKENILKKQKGQLAKLSYTCNKKLNLKTINLTLQPPKTGISNVENLKKVNLTIFTNKRDKETKRIKGTSKKHRQNIY